MAALGAAPASRPVLRRVVVDPAAAGVAAGAEPVERARGDALLHEGDDLGDAVVAAEAERPVAGGQPQGVPGGDRVERAGIGFADDEGAQGVAQADELLAVGVGREVEVGENPVESLGVAQQVEAVESVVGVEQVFDARQGRGAVLFQRHAITLTRRTD